MTEDRGAALDTVLTEVGAGPKPARMVGAAAFLGRAVRATAATPSDPPPLVKRQAQPVTARGRAELRP